MKKIAVFASGGGSDFQAVIDANKREPFCEISLLISSKSDNFAIERAKNNDIPYRVFIKKDYQNAEEMFKKISAVLKEFEIDYIVLAGYLTILSGEFVSEYKNRIINIHPSLIPSFCGEGYYGLKVHQAAIDYGVRISGCTVHFVDEQADTGAVILQRAVAVREGDTAEILQERILEVEHELLPEAVKLLTTGKIEVEGRKVTIKKIIDII